MLCETFRVYISWHCTFCRSDYMLLWLFKVFLWGGGVFCSKCVALNMKQEQIQKCSFKVSLLLSQAIWLLCGSQVVLLLESSQWNFVLLVLWFYMVLNLTKPLDDLAVHLFCNLVLFVCLLYFLRNALLQYFGVMCFPLPWKNESLAQSSGPPPHPNLSIPHQLEKKEKRNMNN